MEQFGLNHLLAVAYTIGGGGGGRGRVAVGGVSILLCLVTQQHWENENVGE